MQTNPLSSRHHHENTSAHVVDEITDCARAAEDAVRRLAHLTIGRPSLTPADVDTVLAHLAEIIATVPQVATQLSRILDHSRDRHLLAMDGMTATTESDLAVETARVHLDAVRDPAVATPDSRRERDDARPERPSLSVV